MATLDLEGNNMALDPESAGVLSLWKEGSVFWHLSVSSNATDLLGFAHLFWVAGRSKVEILDAANMTQ